MSPNNKPKKQHYVPQHLLWNFSTGKKSKAKLWVLDKQREEIFQASIRDVGHENRFYEYHGDARCRNADDSGIG